MSSTDKAVYPINAMGVSKAMMEKVLLLNPELQTQLSFVELDMGMLWPQEDCYTYFYDQIKSGNDITVTDLDMTRFMMTLEDAVSLACSHFKTEKLEIFLFKNLLYNYYTLAKTMKKILNLLSKLKILGYDMLKKSMKPYFQRRENGC